MAEEAPKPEPTTEIPQVAAPLDAGAANGFPTHAVQAEALQKDIVMSDAPADQPARKDLEPPLRIRIQVSASPLRLPRMATRHGNI
ncbi:hypothetical protein ACHAPT_003762 [Fusarium lateritium]